MAIGNVELAANTWVQIADSGLASVSWQVKAGTTVYIAATAADAAPAEPDDDWPEYGFNQGEVALDSTAMFAGVTSAAFLWAYSPGKAGTIWVSHA